MSIKDSSNEKDWLEGELLEAFEKAYPDVERDKIAHISRNFTQVIQGILDISKRLHLDDSEVSHMDVANGMVYWCVASTSLEDVLSGKEGDIGEGENIPLGEETIKRIMSECSARIADWILGLEVLKKRPELFRRFVRAAVMLGAADWETNRGKLHY